MSYFPDLGTATLADDGSYVRAIGWLDNEHGFDTGTVDAECLKRIDQFSSAWLSSTDSLEWGLAMGFHTCNLCNNFHASGNFGVPCGNILYVAPEMLSHYIHCHYYLPPKEFLDAIVVSPLPGTDEYREAVRLFAEDFSRRVEEYKTTSSEQNAATKPIYL